MKTKIINIIGARPQIIKAAAISRCIKKSFNDTIEDIIIHTGQHYDDNMSEVFFREMEIPAPHYNLQVGSSSHAVQTAEIMMRTEDVLNKENPDIVVVYGDTNSTLAAAVAASKLHIPVAHIEAGLRSFNKKMPEEINRVVCDHCSTFLFSPTPTGIANLEKEGLFSSNVAPYNIDNPCILHCGDIMYDNALFFAGKAEKNANIQKSFQGEKFMLATIHRDYNTDNPERLNAIFRSMQSISANYGCLIVIPLHPRTNKIIEKSLEKNLLNDIKNNPRIKILPPVSFFEMIALEKNAMLILTDSGGVQKESYFYEKPCIIVRSETEWVEIVEAGAAIIADADEEKIRNAFDYFGKNKISKLPAIFGDGNAAEFICNTILKNI